MSRFDAGSWWVADMDYARVDGRCAPIEVTLPMMRLA